MKAATPLLLARIQITHYVDSESGEPAVFICALDGADQQLALMECLGLLELTKDSLLHRRPAEEDES